MLDIGWYAVVGVSGQDAFAFFVVAGIAVAVADSAAAGAWLGLKSCQAPHCGRAYYDDSGSSGCSVHAAG